MTNSARCVTRSNGKRRWGLRGGYVVTAAARVRVLEGTWARCRGTLSHVSTLTEGSSCLLSIERLSCAVWLRVCAEGLVQHQYGVLESLDACREHLDGDPLCCVRPDRFPLPEFKDPLDQSVAHGLHIPVLSGELLAETATSMGGRFRDS